jgi:trans-aconitate methyltransferase
LACGPGSISQRILTRFPEARCVAVDYDPVLMAIGQGALGSMDGRLRWVEADLDDDAWSDKLGEGQFDAVLSTTALHWLPLDRLLKVYVRLGTIVRPGGVVLNGDNLDFAPHLPTFQKIAEAVKERCQKDAFEHRDVENWEQWWDALQQEAAVTDLIAEQKRRYADKRRRWEEPDWIEPIADIHEAALRNAGFREVGTIWQNMDNRVIMAIR